MILEDDPYGRLRYSGTPVDAIKTLVSKRPGDLHRLFFKDHRARVFSAPGLDLCAPKELMAKMVVAKQCVDVHTNMRSRCSCMNT